MLIIDSRIVNIILRRVQGNTQIPWSFPAAEIAFHNKEVQSSQSDPSVSTEYQRFLFIIIERRLLFITGIDIGSHVLGRTYNTLIKRTIPQVIFPHTTRS